MEETFALIRENKVVDLIIANESFVNKINDKWDNIVNITNIIPMPSQNWLYDGVKFNPPVIISNPQRDAMIAASERLKLALSNKLAMDVRPIALRELISDIIILLDNK